MVVSIVIGVFATGVINGARDIVVNELARSYNTTQPAHATLFVPGDDSFDDDLIEVIRRIDGVAEAEGRRVTTVSVETLPGFWEDFRLTLIPDFDDMHVNQLRVVQGAAKPRDKEVVIERSSMDLLNASVGDALTIERSDGKQRIMHIAGVVHDLSAVPTSMSGMFYGYVTSDTMEWLGEGADYTQVVLRVAADAPVPVVQASTSSVYASGPNAAVGAEPSMVQIVSVVDEVFSKIEKSGREPQSTHGPKRPPLKRALGNLVYQQPLYGDGSVGSYVAFLERVFGYQHHFSAVSPAD